IKIRLAGHVLFPFLLDCEGPETVEIVERDFPSLFDKAGGKFIAGGEIRHGFKEYEECEEYKEKKSGARIQNPGGVGSVAQRD
ncbi:MAG TPA: hypothetical protein VN939_23825, partial [Chthoniobacterales bacterium]|nr:hypothetical protein [Chthoniobacterales bacterium]